VEGVSRFAPRYPHRLFELIETLDNDGLSLAEVVRRIGAAAEHEGITRPSPVHVRALLSELREQRRDDREIRAAAVETLARVATGRVPDPFQIHRPVERAIEQAELRARRRRR
jgi:hypothetical protein